MAFRIKRKFQSQKSRGLELAWLVDWLDVRVRETMDICASNLRDCQAETGTEKLTLGERNDDFYLRKASSRWLMMWLWGLQRGGQEQKG